MVVTRLVVKQSKRTRGRRMVKKKNSHRLLYACLLIGKIIGFPQKKNTDNSSQVPICMLSKALLRAKNTMA